MHTSLSAFNTSNAARLSVPSIRRMLYLLYGDRGGVSYNYRVYSIKIVIEFGDIFLCYNNLMLLTILLLVIRVE